MVEKSSKLDLNYIRNTVKAISDEIGARVIGSKDTIKFMFIAIVSNNHILLEGVPGLAKTMLANEFSSHLKMQFKRVQFTPDMLPSDIMGNIVFNLETRKMEFREGPVFTNVLLADEINRTPAKVQSALLEAMEEKHVSVGGTTHNLPSPFFVIATQNPIEQEGTFPIAEALMDRFLFRVILTYPNRGDEIRILNRDFKKQDTQTYIDPETILRMRDYVNDVYVSFEIKEYMVDLMRKTRESNKVYIGASPRTTAKLLTASRACALVHGRDFVVPEDLYYIAPFLLNHRLILKPEALMDTADSGVDAAFKVIDEILGEVHQPR
ncbi:MAG: MoxR family ATPase [Candidatus Thermoplasmatota archaeon]|jgi:MoxR-like ATPase|nr:MoxR family ATPase [Candidatus Thermoplasmatota archaeon]